MIFDARLPQSKEKPAGRGGRSQVPGRGNRYMGRTGRGNLFWKQQPAPPEHGLQPKSKSAGRKRSVCREESSGVYDLVSLGTAAVIEMRKEAPPPLFMQAPKKGKAYHFPSLSLLQKPGNKNTETV